MIKIIVYFEIKRFIGLLHVTNLSLLGMLIDRAMYTGAKKARRNKVAAYRNSGLYPFIDALSL
jgi:hypothetical protein